MSLPLGYAFEGDGEDARLVPTVDHPHFTRPGQGERDDTPEPQATPMTSPLQAAALRFACHLEPRPMEEVAAELGVSQQALSDMLARIRERLGFRRERKQRTSKP
jgi:hypothetical protein